MISMWYKVLFLTVYFITCTTCQQCTNVRVCPDGTTSSSLPSSPHIEQNNGGKFAGPPGKRGNKGEIGNKGEKGDMSEPTDLAEYRKELVILTGMFNLFCFTIC